MSHASDYLIIIEPSLAWLKFYFDFPTVCTCRRETMGYY